MPSVGELRPCVSSTSPILMRACVGVFTMLPPDPQFHPVPICVHGGGGGRSLCRRIRDSKADEYCRRNMTSRKACAQESALYGGTKAISGIMSDLRSAKFTWRKGDEKPYAVDPVNVASEQLSNVATADTTPYSIRAAVLRRVTVPSCIPYFVLWYWKYFTFAPQCPHSHHHLLMLAPQISLVRASDCWFFHPLVNNSLCLQLTLFNL